MDEPTRTDQIGVIIVDEQAMVAEALAVAVPALGCRVIGVATDRVSALALVDQHSAANVGAPGVERAERAGVDVVVCELIDIDRLIPQILQRSPDTKVLVLTGRTDDWSLATAVDAGCHGYVVKDQTLDELMAAISAVMSGEAAFAPAVLSRVLRMLRPGTSAELLTARETDVLRRLADGLTTEQIASDLYLSVNTVRNHVNSIIRKLNVHSRLEAVSAAIRRGLISVG